MQIQHGGNIHQIAKQDGLKPEEIIDFSANLNFLGPPPLICEKIREKTAMIQYYPEANSTYLKSLIAEDHQLQAAQVLVGNGAADLIYQLLTVLSPRKVLIVEPTFSEYEAAANSCGADIKHFYLNPAANFELDLEQLISYFKEIDLLFICNPNNPTSQLWQSENLQTVLAAAAAEDIYLVIDEAFNDFLAEPEENSLLRYLAEYKNLFILKSLTKLYAIPGLRLGYLLGTAELLTKISAARDLWTVNYFAQLAGEIIFKRPTEIKNYLAESRKKLADYRQQFYQALKKFKQLKVYQPAANFIFLKLESTDHSVIELQQKLATNGILIRNCSNFPGLNKNYFRLAVRSKSENEILITKLNQLLS